MEPVVRILALLTLLVAGLGGLFGGVMVYGGISTLVGGGDPIAESPSVPLSGASLELRGARGRQIEFRIVDDIAIEGYWASDTGLTLTLRNPQTAFETRLQVVSPEEKDWDETITSVGASSDDGPEIGAAFTVPDVPGPETQTLSGTLTGELEYPEERDDGAFEDVTIDLEIPVRLEVASDEEAASASGSSRSLAVRRLLAGVFALVVALAYAIPWARWNDEEPNRRRWEPALMMGTGLAAWLFAGAYWLFRDFFGA